MRQEDAIIIVVQAIVADLSKRHLPLSVWTYSSQALYSGLYSRRDANLAGNEPLIERRRRGPSTKLLDLNHEVLKVCRTHPWNARRLRQRRWLNRRELLARLH